MKPILAGGVISAALALLAAATFMPTTARGEIFVASYGNGTIGAYTNSGATVNTSLITGFGAPEDVAVSGSNLFVADSGSGTIGEYTTSGAVVNASLISGLNGPVSIAVSGSNLFVLSNYTIGEYTTTGQTVNAHLITGLMGRGIAVSGSELYVVNAGGSGTIGMFYLGSIPGTISFAVPSLISGLDYPACIAVSESDLFVTEYRDGTIGEYTTMGQTVNAHLVTGLDSPLGIAVSGSNLFVANSNGSTIGEYTTSGQTVNASLILDRASPFGIAVTPDVPEPTTIGILGLGVVGLLVRRKGFGR